MKESAPKGWSWGRRAFYRLAQSLIVAFCKVFWRLSVEGTEHIPATGPFILAPVHRSNVDTPIVAAITGRRLRFMGKDSMWKYRPFAWLFTTLGGFPVHRGTADREAMRLCGEVLDGGEPLVLFPEGQRQSGPLIDELFDGTAFLAARHGVAIVPVGIGGSERAMPKGARFLRPVKVHVVVGAPLAVEHTESGRAPRRAVKELTVNLRQALQQVFDEAQVKAGA